MMAHRASVANGLTLCCYSMMGGKNETWTGFQQKVQQSRPCRSWWKNQKMGLTAKALYIRYKKKNMSQERNSRLQGKTEEILKGMLEMLRESDETGISLDEFIDYLQNKKRRTSETNTKEWNPADRSKERTVFRYIQQLTKLGCRIDYKNSSKTFVLRSKDWRFPENNWSLSSSAILKVGDLLLPILKDIVLPQDILERIDEGIRISIKDKEIEEVRKTVVLAWAERKELLINYNRGKGNKAHNIEPHGLVFRNSEWQIAAKEGEQVKTFSLSKIVDAKLVSRAFTFDAEVLDKALAQD